MPIEYADQKSVHSLGGGYIEFDDDATGEGGGYIEFENQVMDRRFETPDPRKQSFTEFKLMKSREADTSLYEDATEFMNGVATGIGQLFRMGMNATEEGYEAIQRGEYDKLAMSGVEGVAKGIFDTTNLAESIAGNVGDYFVDDETALFRQFSRAKEERDDFETREAGLVFDQEQTFKNLTEVGSVVLDPLNLIGLGLTSKVAKASKLGQTAIKAGNLLDMPANLTRKALRGSLKGGAKGAAILASASAKPLRVLSKGAEKAENIIGIPNDAITGVVSKTLGISPSDAGLLRHATPVGQLATPLAPLATAELGAKAAKIGLGGAANLADDAAALFNALGDPSRQLRFIEKAIQDKSISPATRKALSIAGSGGTKAMDLAFNSLSNGASAASLQGIFAAMAGQNPNEVGQAVGTGLAFGGVMPFGPKGGADQAARDKGSISYLQAKFSKDQMDNFNKLPDNSQKLVASLLESGIEANVILQDKKTFTDTYNRESGQSVKSLDTAGFIAENGSIFVNSDAKSVDIDSVVLHEVGHRVAREMVLENRGGSIVGLRNEILKDFQSPTGTELTTTSGAKVKVGGVLEKFYKDYNSQVADQHKIKDADTLVDEYLADSLGVLFDETDFNAVEAMRKTPGTLEMLSRTSHAMLSKLGLVDPETGGKMKNFTPISKSLVKNPMIQRALKNHASLDKAIELHAGDRAKSVKRRSGQSDESVIRGQDVDPGEVFIASDLDISQPGVKKIVGNYFNNTIVEPRQAAPGKTGENIGSVIADSYFDAVGATPTMRRVATGFEKAIAEVGSVKFWKKKGKNDFQVKEGVPFGFIINQSNGNISVKYWNQLNLNKLLSDLKSKGLIDSVKSMQTQIEAARQRNAQGQNISNEKIAALFGALPDTLSTKDAKSIAMLAQKRGGVFEQVSIKDIRAFKDHNTPGMGVRHYNALMNMRPDGGVPVNGGDKTHSAINEGLNVSSVNEGGHLIEMEVQTPDGRGNLRAGAADDNKSVLISDSYLPDDLQDTGLGTKMYSELIDQSFKEGFDVVYSDSTVSPSADRVYQSLKKQGYSVIPDPSVTTKGTDKVSKKAVYAVVADKETNPNFVNKEVSTKATSSIADGLLADRTQVVDNIKQSLDSRENTLFDLSMEDLRSDISKSGFFTHGGGIGVKKNKAKFSKRVKKAVPDITVGQVNDIYNMVSIAVRDGRTHFKKNNLVENKVTQLRKKINARGDKPDGIVWSNFDESDVEIFKVGDKDIKDVLQSIEKVGVDKFRIYEDSFNRIVIKEKEKIPNPYHLI